MSLCQGIPLVFDCRPDCMHNHCFARVCTPYPPLSVQFTLPSFSGCYADLEHPTKGHASVSVPSGRLTLLLRRLFLEPPSLQNGNEINLSHTRPLLARCNATRRTLSLESGSKKKRIQEGGVENQKRQRMGTTSIKPISTRTRKCVQPGMMVDRSSRVLRQWKGSQKKRGGKIP